MKKWTLLLALTFPAYPSFAEDQPRDDIGISISESADGSHVLEGNFSVSASTVVIWDVLTDYDHMADFVSSIKSSRRLEREKEHEIVEQVMSGKAGFFRKKIYLLLSIDEQVPQKILFQDVSKRSFKKYSGSWEIIPLGGQIQVHYRLEAMPDFFAPDFIAIKAFKNTVKLLLTEVRNEIASRKEH